MVRSEVSSDAESELPEAAAEPGSSPRTAPN